LNVRVAEAASAKEIFVTAKPAKKGDVQEQARTLLAEVAEVLRRHGAHPMQERLFGTEAAVEQAAALRPAAYGDLDDGVPPNLLVVPEGPTGALAGIQVHAIATDETPTRLGIGDKACGRLLQAGGVGYVALSGITAPETGDRSQQARAIFEKAMQILRPLGGTMRSVARTWLWLGDILAWYDTFNAVRNRFFTECGLIDPETQDRHLPASTGIGVGPAGEAECALDVVAMVGPKVDIRYYRAAGMQQSAYNYGSAFSRMASAVTPAGTCVYVSGTAAIDEAGATMHVGDAPAQVKVTVDNVRACLRDLKCTDDDVVHAIAYSKTPEVQALFDAEYAARMPWPCVSVLSDVCRDDLLFEMEATAWPGVATE